MTGWRPWLGVVVVAAVAAFQLWVPANNPPGFFRDEAAVAYNAHLIAHEGRDEYGARFPLYFSSSSEYRSPIFVYGLAGVFQVTETTKRAARGFAAVSILAAVLLLGWLGYRRTGSGPVGVATVVLAGTSPWLFELGRVAFEVAMQPLFLCLVLLGVERASRLDRWSPLSALPVSLALGAITYVDAGGRFLAPLLAAALLVVVGRGRWSWILTAWGAFLATQIPLLLYTRAHPGALSPGWEIGWRVPVNYLQDLQLWHYVVSGDRDPYAHTPGAGALLWASVLLALVGLWLVLTRHRSDPFWRYAVAALAVSPLPAALMIDRFHALRLAPFAVLLVVVAIPALDELRSRRGLAAALAVVAAAQFAFFVHNFRTDGPLRTGRFEAGVPTLLEPVWASGGTVYVDYDDLEPLTLARWYALENGVDQTRVVRLLDGGVPPTGAIAFGRTQLCDYACTRLEESGEYWIARAEGPG